MAGNLSGMWLLKHDVGQETMEGGRGESGKGKNMGRVEWVIVGVLVCLSINSFINLSIYAVFLQSLCQILVSLKMVVNNISAKIVMAVSPEWRECVCV